MSNMFDCSSPLYSLTLYVHTSDSENFGDQMKCHIMRHFSRVYTLFAKAETIFREKKYVQSYI